jgi:glycosyltransferase involved in cell wall biosynthesis
MRRNTRRSWARSNASIAPRTIIWLGRRGTSFSCPAVPCVGSSATLSASASARGSASLNGASSFATRTDSKRMLLLLVNHITTAPSRTKPSSIGSRLFSPLPLDLRRKDKRMEIPLLPLVIHLVTKLENGGAQRHALHVVAGLPKDRFEVVLAYGPGGYLDPEAASISDLELWPIAGLRRSIGPLGDALAVRELVRRIKAVRGDRPVLLQTHSSKAGVVGRIAGRLAGATTVHTVHGFGFHAGASAIARKVLHGVERSMAPLTDWALCVSQADLDYGSDHGLFSGQRASVIRAGIDIAAHRRDASAGQRLRSSLGFADDVPLVGTVACLKPQKAPLEHIQAFATLRVRVPNAQFLWVGDGVLRRAVIAEAERLGVADGLHLLGWTDEVPAILSALDAFVLISHWEGLPRALLEARAAGVPCVVSDRCGNPEAVGYGSAGFVVPAGATEEAGERLAELLTNEALHRGFAERSGEGLDGFDVRHIVPRHVELYDTLLVD